MARRKGEIVRVRDKQLYLRKDAAWTDAGHQRLEKKIAEDSVISFPTLPQGDASCPNPWNL